MVLFLKNQLAWAQEKQIHWANQHCQPHPSYKIGDMIYVNAKHFANERNSKSLSMKNAEPWRIVKNINNKVYKLEIS